MFDENQIVKIKWSGNNKKYFVSLGYKFTKHLDEFSVKVKDLLPNSRARIIARCDYCNREYEVSYYALLYSRKNIEKDACIDCSYIKSKEVTLQKRADEIYTRAKVFCDDKRYVLLTPKSEYENVHSKAIYICPIHGVKTTTFNNLKNGYGCQACANAELGELKKLSKDELLNIINSTSNATLLNPDEYETVDKRNLKIKCGCGNIYTTSYNSFLRTSSRCPQCTKKESVGEYKIRQFLEDRHIVFEQEKRFLDCKDKSVLPFDFYLPLHNMCVEFDGQQHFSPKFGDESFQSTLSHDKIKNEYCQNNGIKLIRIPYWNGDKINEILSKEIQI